MTTQFVEEYINYKISKNEYEIIFTFFELRVKENLSEEQVEDFLRLSKIRLENLGYSVYFTGTKIILEGKTREVKQNELMVAIKEKIIEKEEKKTKKLKARFCF